MGEMISELRKLLSERVIEYFEIPTIRGTRFDFYCVGQYGYYTGSIGVDGANCYAMREHLEPIQAVDIATWNGVNGETSDGYHTFNELYHHRAVLFSVIVRDHQDRAWKSRMHHDGTMYDGMFIVGIDTPEGQATYHYNINPYWDMFDCRELERAPEWDGHTPDDAIARIAKLGREKCSFIPDEQGYMWCDKNGEWHEEEDSAADECWSASCDKCGLQMMVGDEGWFRGYDEPKEWLDEDGKEHCGFILEPIFRFCPNCGREVER